MAPDRVERRLAAILCADVVGYSRLMGDDEEATLRTLTDYREIMRARIEAHAGRVVDAPGDALLAKFASPVEAVAAAAEIQQRLAARNAQLENHRRMEMRIGINLGDVLHKDGALYGEGVNTAAPRGICVSGMVHESVENKLDTGFEDLGEHEFKNIAKPVRAYRVVEHDAEQAAPDRETPLELPDKPSIAVLPFANMSGDAEQDVVGDGLAEDVIVTLSQLSNLFVIARQSSFVFKDRTSAGMEACEKAANACVSPPSSWTTIPASRRGSWPPESADRGRPGVPGWRPVRGLC